MIIPSYLQPNDTIGITAPASSISREDIDDTIKTLESWGLNVSISKTIGSKFNQFAATDSERLSELQMMLDNPEIKAILCARGGYGTVRIIDKIDFSKFVKHPKWLIGFSDITVLHSHINSI